MNKKAFTLVELIVSFSLAVVICIFLLQLILSLKTLYDNSGVKTEILNKQSLISNQINNTFNSKTISSLSNCGEACINVNYTDNTKDILKIDYNTNTLQFGNFYTTLPENTYFKNASVDIIYSGVVDNNSNDALLSIIIPIENERIKKEKFGLNIVYQFNSNKSNIEYVNFSSSENYIVLKGDTEQVFNSKTAYIEEGYTVYDKNGNVTTGTVDIDNPLTNLPYKTGNYKIKYSLKDSSGNIISQATRSVTVTPSTYNITNLVTNGSFEDGISGWDNVMSSITHEIITDSNNAKFGSSYAKIIFDAGGWARRTISNLNINNKYYVSAYINIVDRPSGNAGIRVNDYVTNVTAYSNTKAVVTNGYEKFGGIFSSPSNELQFWYGGDVAGPTAYYDGYLLVDLTEAFGAGNEPSQEWCDENINWFDGTTTISY